MKKILLGLFIILIIAVATGAAFLFLVAKAPYKIDEDKMSKDFLDSIDEVGGYKFIGNNAATEEEDGIFAVFLTENGENPATGEQPSQIFYSSDDTVYGLVTDSVKDEDFCTSYKFGNVNSVEYVRADCKDAQVYIYRVNKNKFLAFQIYGDGEDLKEVLKAFK
jgi:hypothetical protein